MNTENYKLVLAHIEKHPAKLDQGSYHGECGTHCFAGWAQLLAGKEIDSFRARWDAMHFLGINSEAASYLFSNDRTLEDFRKYLTAK